MMKKLISFICITVLLLSMSMTALAGSIPEDLLQDESQIFFAEIVYTHLDKEKPDIEFSPVKKIKGDVKLGSKQIAYNFNTVGDFKLKEGNVYLFTYFDENNPTDIFDVTSYDTSTLKLKNVEGDMWERFEEYLNEGKYEEAERERRERLGLSEEASNETDDANLPPLENSYSNLTYWLMDNLDLACIIGAMVLIVVAGTVVFIVRRKRGKRK